MRFTFDTQIFLVVLLKGIRLSGNSSRNLGTIHLSADVSLSDVFCSQATPTWGFPSSYWDKVLTLL
jgi:hypothetical protein